jgi:carnitine O-acetyltransferase
VDPDTAEPNAAGAAGADLTSTTWNSTEPNATELNGGDWNGGDPNGGDRNAAELMAAGLDATGKVSLDHVYTQPDPRAYFSTLRGLEYRIPQLAKPYFSKVLDECHDRRGTRAPRVLDIGCSYGVNAALLRLDATMDELYDHYCDGATPTLSRDSLLARDRELVRARSGLDGITVVGLDTSYPALSYALAAGFLTDAVHADLEKDDPTEEQRTTLGGSDLVISTGCLGYVTERTIARVVAAHGDRRPWMAHFVLRMFPFDPVAAVLDDAGYETVAPDRVFAQRRFASAAEQSQVLDTLSTVKVDPRGLESDGWLYARLFVSRPRDTPRRTVFDVAAGDPRVHSRHGAENSSKNGSENSSGFHPENDARPAAQNDGDRRQG